MSVTPPRGISVAKALSFCDTLEVKYKNVHRNFIELTLQTQIRLLTESISAGLPIRLHTLSKASLKSMKAWHRFCSVGGSFHTGF